MSDVQRYTGSMLFGADKAFRYDSTFVLASDYDAKCAELATARADCDACTRELAEVRRSTEDYYNAMKLADDERQSAQWKSKRLRASVERLRAALDGIATRSTFGSPHGREYLEGYIAAWAECAIIARAALGADQPAGGDNG